MEKQADLHLHTNFSDGTYTPEELAEHGKRLGFAVLALTDHDTVDGCERMQTACDERGIEFIPASEITVDIDGHEMHLLSYCLDTANDALLTALRKSQSNRKNRVHEMVAKLNELGVPLKTESVFEIAQCDAPGRPHIGRALVKEGHCNSVDDAFQRYLKIGRPAWVPKPKLSAAEAIRLVHLAGGVAVMAHPGLNRIDQCIPKLVQSGLDGIECFHSRHSTNMSERYLQLADDHGLLVTGGSDCHGMNKGKPLIGSVKIPYLHVEQLKEKARQVRAARGNGDSPKGARQQSPG